MNPANRNKLAGRIARAAEASLGNQGYVSFVDVLTGIGWLHDSAVKRWRQGQVGFLESEVQTKMSRIIEAMELFRAWAVQKGLRPSETDYVARSSQRETLRFSVSGDPAIERLCRTHWISPALSEMQRERVTAKANGPPELVAIQPLNEKWACHRCGGTGDLLIMEAPGPACLRCAGLDGLEFLPAGDALLTRRAKAGSPRFAVVVWFSKSRGRYERQGLLVQPQALSHAQSELEASPERLRTDNAAAHHRPGSPPQ